MVSLQPSIHRQRENTLGMHALPRLICLTPAVMACALAGVTQAEEKPVKLAPAEYSAELGIGAEYDSNVSVEEVDVSSNQGDHALTLNACLGASKE